MVLLDRLIAVELMDDPLTTIRHEIADAEEAKRSLYDKIQALSERIAELYKQESELLKQRDTQG